MVFSTLEEPRDVMFQHSEGRIEVFQHSNHCVVPLYILLGLLQCVICIEASVREGYDDNRYS